MAFKRIGHVLAALLVGAVSLVPMRVGAEAFEAEFDKAFGTELREPASFQATYPSPLEQRISQLAASAKGRIGVAALDLATGEQVSILGNQRFPMASTSKIAIAATFLEGVDQGRWSLDDKFPLMVPLATKPLSTKVAPVKPGARFTARELIEMMITRSNNQATDGLLAVVGGPQAVNDWVRRAGIRDFRIDRDIATLVRDDGVVDPATSIDLRDSATPLAMVQLLKGIHEGRWLSSSSRLVLLGAMERCLTGKNRIRGNMPADVIVAHKTGSLYNTSSDVGIITTPEGRTIAVAIYVTGGQNDRGYRIDRIATIARALYDGYTQPRMQWVNATYDTAPAGGGS